MYCFSARTILSGSDWKNSLHDDLHATKSHTYKKNNSIQVTEVDIIIYLYVTATLVLVLWLGLVETVLYRTSQNSAGIFLSKIGRKYEAVQLEYLQAF